MATVRGRAKPDDAIVAQAVELLGHHAPRFGEAGFDSGILTPSPHMDLVPDDLKDSLLAACVSAAKFLKATFDGMAEPPTPPDR